jgi:endonuclease YncB( thermonuclease family)
MHRRSRCQHFDKDEAFSVIRYSPETLMFSICSEKDRSQGVAHFIIGIWSGLVIVLLSLAPALAADITGKATVIDGGTIQIGDHRIHLFGLDAPHGDQMCVDNGQSWNCGQQATWALAYELAEHWVTCRDTGMGSTQSTTAVCYIGGTRDVGERMVRQGWARADPYIRQNYVPAEAEARANRAGLWRNATK